VLTAKYGSPTLSKKGIAVTTMGAQIETITAGWSFADLSISFSSVFTRADSGLISIETTKGAAATVAAKIQEGPKLRRSRSVRIGHHDQIHLSIFSASS